MHKPGIALEASELVDERLRLARNLHDTVAQSLASLGFALDEIIDQLRDEIHSLRRFENLSLAEWIREEIDLPIDYSSDFFGPWSDDRYEHIGYLVIELINNAIAHQGVRSLRIKEEANALEISFERAELSRRVKESKERSFGLIGVRERLEQINGQLIEGESGFLIRW
ncbi:MAG: histidine kinase [Actinomycetota bacterium]|nr:histidine kinase [Actinomycetota bacterium]